MGKANREAAYLTVQKDGDLSTGARLLLLYLGDLISDNGGELTAGCDYLAAELGTSDSSVRRWRKELAEAGHLTPLFIGPGGDKSNTYRFTPTPPRTKGYPSTDEGVTPPRPLHDPSTGGGEQEQEQKAAAAMDDESLYNDAILIASHKPKTVDVHAVARKILAEDDPADIRQRAARIRGDIHYGEPNDPDTCNHNFDEEDYCNRCRTWPVDRGEETR